MMDNYSMNPFNNSAPLWKTEMRFCKTSGGQFNNVIIASLALFLSSQVSFAADGALTGTAANLPTINTVETDSQTSDIGAADCAQQLDDFIFGTDLAALILEGAKIGAAAGAVSANQAALVSDALGLTGEALGAPSVGIAAQIVAIGLSQAAVLLEADELLLAAGALANQSAATAANQVASGLPNCNSTFTGSVVVEAGGIDVTGNSTINGDFGITGDLTATKGEFGQGVSAYDGQLSLGDSGLESFFAGITIGGGEFAGAGTGGSDSFTGHVNAIAIGNGASASNAGSIAFGQLANSSATDAVAIGSRSSASGLSSVALGNGASATVQNAVAIGNASSATGIDSLALGSNASSVGLNGAAFGTRSSAAGPSSLALGDRSSAAVENATALGTSSSATGIGSLALGNTASSSALNAIAIGTASVASGINASSFGRGATSAFENSTAIGTGATTTIDNQIVFGTTEQSLTAPGISSPLSASRQVGKLSLATTDDGGNLAFDGGAVFKEIANNRQGIAVALATQNPDLVAGEKGAIVFNFGSFKDATAISIGGAKVINENIYSDKDRLTVSGSIGINITRSEFMTRKSDPYNTGGRIGMQYSWR